MDPELASALPSLWKPLLVLFLILSVILFREPIKNFLNRMTNLRYRQGDRELLLSSEASEGNDEPQAQLGSAEETIAEQVEEGSGDTTLELDEHTPSDPVHEMIVAFMSHDTEAGEEAYRRAQAAESSAVQKLRNEAMYLHLRYKCGDVSALGQLQNLAQQVHSAPEAEPNVLNLLGLAYEESNEFSKAAGVYESAANTAQTEEDRAQLLVSASRCLFSAGDREIAFGKITDEIQKTDDSKALSTLYAGLAALYHEQGNSELRAIALEKAIENSPNDVSLRFDAAYSYSEENLRPLALLHYDTLLDFRPDHRTALNNIAVTYGELEMPVHKVQCLQKSVEHKESLASANLAYQYMNAGFIQEATQILGEAKQYKNPHQNVGRALADIAAKPEAEREVKEKHLEDAQQQRRFLVSFAEAYFLKRPLDPNFEGSWFISGDTEATITRDNHQIRIEWTWANSPHQIIAHARNYGAKVDKYTRGEHYLTSLGSGGYAYLSEDSKEIRVMILRESGVTEHDHYFLILTRQQ
jgi:tetratricopeptide (TPR) repeat protein